MAQGFRSDDERDLSRARGVPLTPAEAGPASREMLQRKTQIILAGVCAALVVLDVVAALVFAWWRARMIADFWPIDDSRIGPKLVGTLVQAVLGVIVVAIFWPPLRRRITSLFEDGGRRANREMHEKLAEMHERMEHLMNHHADLHAKMDHIISHHPDVPEFRASIGSTISGNGDEPVGRAAASPPRE